MTGQIVLARLAANEAAQSLPTKKIDKHSSPIGLCQRRWPIELHKSATDRKASARAGKGVVADAKSLLSREAAWFTN